MAAPFAKLRPDVSSPCLLSTVRQAFKDVPDKRRQARVKYSMHDTLMAGLAIFSIITEDALAANGPHIKTLLEHGMDYIIVAKVGSCESCFKNLIAPGVSTTEWESLDPETGFCVGIG